MKQNENWPLWQSQAFDFAIEDFEIENISHATFRVSSFTFWKGRRSSQFFVIFWFSAFSALESGFRSDAAQT